METLNIEVIKINGGTQQRAEINQEHVADLADALKGGAKLPPVRVFHDGADYWLSRGFHRYHAHRASGLKTIVVEVLNGTQRDAKLDSVGDNAEHNALRRSNADKRKAVETLLADEEWSKWSDREISRRCSVSYALVADIRKAHLPEVADAPLPRKVSRGGKTFTQKPKKQRPASITRAEVTDTATVEDTVDTSETVQLPPPAPPKTEEKPADPDAPPWVSFNDTLDGFISELRSVALRLGKALEYDSTTKRLGHRFAHFLTHAGTVGAINAVARTLADNRPAATSDKPPGYLPVRVVEARKSVA